MSVIAFARQQVCVFQTLGKTNRDLTTVVFVSQGVSSFWGGTPNTANENVVMHWIQPGGTNLVFKQGEKRCILISSGEGRAERMYAHLVRCLGLPPR